jgi:acylphosphatase
MIRRVRILVAGRVQGIGYRAAVLRRAEALKLAGWVRNLRDGQVEIQAEGAADGISDLIGFCHHGPLGARVEECRVSDEAAQGALAGFEVRPTA